MLLINEISQTERYILQDFTYTWNLKPKTQDQTNKIETVTDTENRWLPEGKASRDGREMGERKLVQISSYKVNNRDEMYSEEYS